jgi:hypothetical protein
VTDPTQKVPPGLTDSLDKVQVLIDRIERRQDDQSKIIAEHATIIADLRKRIDDLTRDTVKGGTVYGG